MICNKKYLSKSGKIFIYAKNFSMKEKQHNLKYLKSGLTIALTIIVFCFWTFVKPHILLAREQSQLFLWNREYLLEHLKVPGGLAKYIGELLVQFYINPILGAFIYTLLFVIAQLLTWKIIRSVFPERKDSFILWLISFVPFILLWWLSTQIYVSMTLIVAIVLTLAIIAYLQKNMNYKFITVIIFIIVGYWFLGPAVVLSIFMLLPDWRKFSVGLLLLACCIIGSTWYTPYPLRQVARGIDYYWERHSIGTEEEMRADMLMRGEQWQTLATLYSKEQPKFLSLHNLGSLALFKTKRINEQTLQKNFSVSNKMLTSQSSSFIMSDVFMQLGMVNMAQRAAFEAMESIPNYNKSGRALSRLAETNLIIGEYEVSRKYLDILDETTFYRNWVRRLRPLIDNPELIEKHPYYGAMRKQHNLSSDVFFY